MLTLNTIDYIHVRVTDLKRALEWYKDVLGLVPDTRYRHHASHAMTVLTNPSGTVRLALSLESAVRQNPARIAFSVSGKDFHAWIDTLAGLRVTDRNGQTIARDSVRDYAFYYSIIFCDPFGNPFEIVSYDHTWLAGKIKQTDPGLGSVRNVKPETMPAAAEAPIPPVLHRSISDSKITLN
jgi:catechol 2,3-dioxygenase-like lactoylglutathione lyase family enzyme